ncbi:insulin-like receptor isoform X3 [Danaus plexippus]|uniref:insulin-like receptor isoform X3 n=1 Tax=Danaus plexippus TaxID=13037 RepID=UPI002AAFD917|nr:insulin-like receptor isoform X3 [Danaus plexippus]
MRRPCWVAWPVVAWALLLASDQSAADTIAPGICPSIDIRNHPEQMSKLRDCRVIEGYLNIVLMERATEASFVNVSFPLLREVTGYILIYRLKGVRNLGDLFPNLTVIRGMQLFKDFALVIFDNEGLESLGLHSLSRIESGAVRIQNNDHLCYANTIDWSRINAEGPQNNIIRSNYDTRLCGLCPNAQSRMDDHRQHRLQCPSDFTGRLLCWDEKHCQKRDCPSKCGKRACMDTGECCHASCLGGCSGPFASDCYACTNFSLDYGKNRTCMERCPANTYELHRRCVTEQECRSTPPPLSGGRQQINAYKILRGRSCVYSCPAGYMEVGTRNNSTCEPCPASGCVRECPGGKVDSVASAEDFRGCTHIKGTLDISVRARGGNTVAVLESTLGEIRVIEGALRVVRAVPVVSLMFLRSLQRIGGKNADKGQSLYIFNNPNLEMLWNWSTHKSIEISEGRLFIHFNPKLCYSQLLPLKNMTKIPVKTFSENEVSQDNNGDQASCFQDTLHLKVSELFPKVVILKWDTYCLEDSRKLLGYSIYYVAAEHNVTLYGQRDACSDNWNVLDVTIDEARNNTKEEPKNKKALLQSPCNTPNQPLFYPLSQLTPYTRYAAYVKTYTTLQDRKGAQSPIIYFQTLPGPPSPPLGLTVESLKDHSATIKWQPPSMSNGTIILYYVEIQANNYNRPKILALNVNYCGNPSALVNMIAMRGEEGPDKEKKERKGEGAAGGEGVAGGTGEVGGECACRDDARPTRFSSVAEQERVESINFENELQNLVYVKVRQSAPSNESSSSRIRRSVTAAVNSMLVILTDPHSPHMGRNNTNDTDGKYVKSLYYDLEGSARSLTVENLRHFTWYTVNVWACRERDANETYEAYERSWCSERAHYTFRTLERSNADVVRSLQAEVLPSNKTLPEVNVTWVPPEDPNGFVVAYNVYHSRVENNNQEMGLGSCITAEDYEANGRGVLVRNLAPGNYSLRVTPLTLAGSGNVSTDLYVFIPERAVEQSYEWVWGVVVACGVLVSVVVVGVWYARRTLQPAETNKLFASVNPEYVSTVYVPDEWEVPRGNIEFVRELGQGSFGMVYEGIVKNIEKGKPETRCAVKTVNEHATDRERIEFLNEASVMKAFDTFHVVRLLGVVSRGQPTLVVMELMEHGDLKSYLRSHRPDADSSLPKKGANMQPPTLQNILQMAIEIADGMAYLSAKKFVHRDLAARNCMVAGDLTVKVGDFGMTRDIYETDYYRKGTKGLLPVRWMSPESLKDGVFSSNSDVWSYGVVLWEMATLAMQPYQGLSNEQVVRYVVEGGVMERPEHCPDRLYELMRACWAHRAPARPSFLRLVADLAPAAQPYFRHRSFFHTPQGQEMYALQRTALEASAEQAAHC